MLQEFEVKTRQKSQLVNISEQVAQAVTRCGLREGLVVVFIPHTTAGVTINENADPDVGHDLLLGLEKAFPDRQDFRHFEGNSAAHLKASALGFSCQVIVEQGQLKLGTWQGIYLAEFDGPRQRKVWVRCLAAPENVQNSFL